MKSLVFLGVMAALFAAACGQTNTPISKPAPDLTEKSVKALVMDGSCGGASVASFTATASATVDSLSKTISIQLKCKTPGVCASFDLSCNDKWFCRSLKADSHGQFADVQIYDDQNWFFGYGNQNYSTTCMFQVP